MSGEVTPEMVPNLLLEAMENLSPVLDAADGLRADLERRGWSPTAAEAVATTWINGALSAMWRRA